MYIPLQEQNTGPPAQETTAPLQAGIAGQLPLTALTIAVVSLFALMNLKAAAAGRKTA